MQTQTMDTQTIGIQMIGTLFTDEHHSIIFIDKALQAQLGLTQESVGRILGMPVHSLFGFTMAQYQNFLDQYIKSDAQQEINLDLIGQDGNPIPSTVMGVLNIDSQSNLMGVDYRIKPNSSFTAPIVSTLSDPLVNEILRFYFKRQMEVLYETATMWAGKRVGTYLNKVVNDTSQLNGWGVEMDANKITLSDDIQSVDIYLGLLAKAAVYMSSLIGERLVHKQIDAVNDNTNAMTFDYIDRNWFRTLDK